MNEISLKKDKEIAIMRAGGKITARVLNKLKKEIKPGITTSKLDQIAEKLIAKSGAKPAFKGFYGYPASTCISVNDELVHTIPTAKKIQEGDIVGLDLGIFYQGYYTDAAITVGVGKISPKAKKLIQVTKESLEGAIQAVKEDIYLGDIQALIQEKIERAGFGVIRDLSGHGVGKNLQEEPSIPNFGKRGTGPILKEGMTLAIEPMVSAGDWHIKVLDDGWTVKTADGSLSAHFEHTIVVTKDGAEILTQE